MPVITKHAVVVTAAVGAGVVVVVVVVVIILNVAASTVIVCIPVLVAHVGHLLLGHKRVGLNSLQHKLLQLDDIVILLDGGLGHLTVNGCLVCHLSVGFKLHVGGSLL